MAAQESNTPARGHVTAHRGHDLTESEKRHLAAFLGDCEVPTCKLCSATRCTGKDDDWCATLPGLGRCVACHYIYHDIPQDSDNAHDELCCQSVHGCLFPDHCVTHYDGPIGGVTPPPVKFVEEEEVAPLFNEDGTPSDFTIQMLQGKGF